MSAALTPHPFAEAIHAFADGHVIQVRLRGAGPSGWIDVVVSDGREFRIKPMPEIVRFRSGVRRTDTGVALPFCCWTDQEAILQEGREGFLGWAGPWQEVDVATLARQARGEVSR